MIHHALQVVSKDLNQFLRNRLGVNEEVVLLSELVNQDGSVAMASENKVVCTLLNIEQERTNLNAPINTKVLANAPVNLNLYVLFSSYYSASNYLEALKALSLTVLFFQGKQVFTQANTPGLGPIVEKLTVEMVNVEMHELTNFWTAIGAKHLPCVLYKFRMLSIAAEAILEEISDIRSLESR